MDSKETFFALYIVEAEDPNEDLKELPFYNYVFEDDEENYVKESPFRQEENIQEDDLELALQKVVVSAEGFFPTEASELDENYDLTCFICYVNSPHSMMLYCTHCDLYSCYGCFSRHVFSKITEGFVQIYCPGDSCSRVLSDQLLSAFAPNTIPIYMKNRVELENNPNKKTCPGCHKIEVINPQEPKNKIKCSSCETTWCFPCHAPWHSNMTCEKYKRDVVGPGKKALKYWAKSKLKDSSNARKCPSCHFYIERISGCDHMSCSKCKTDFCYRCGGQHRSFGWFGDHHSTYSFLGCKYNLHPKRPALRIAVRTSATFGVLLAAPVIGCLCIAAGAVVIAASPILVPVKIYKKCR